jgi:hypothetical protein
MNGILQLPNTGWLVTAAKAFGGFPGYLLGPANDETLKIILKYISKDHINLYKGKLGALRTLQQFKARLQNQAFSSRGDIQRSLDESLKLHFSDPSSFNSVKMDIEVNIAVWELSTGTAHGEHDQIIGNQFAQAQFKAVKKGFPGPSAVQSRLLTTFGRIIQLYLQGYPMGISEVFDQTLGAFYHASPPTLLSMAFYGPTLSSMGRNPSHYQNFRAISRRYNYFPGYVQ